MKAFLAVIIAVFTFSHAMNAQYTRTFSQPQVVYYEQPVYQQPQKPSRVNKVLRVLGVALAYTAPIVAENRKATRTVQIATLAVAVTCEIRNCQNGSQYGDSQGTNYSAAQSSQVNIGNGGYANSSYPTTAFTSGSYATTNTQGYQPIMYSSPENYAPPEIQYITSSPATFQQDQPSSSLRARVEWVKNRLRQLGGWVRGIRFRRTGPYQWECQISYSIRNRGDGYCLIRTNGTIEGLP